MTEEETTKIIDELVDAFKREGKFDQLRKDTLEKVISNVGIFLSPKCCSFFFFFFLFRKINFSVIFSSGLCSRGQELKSDVYCVNSVTFRRFSFIKTALFFLFYLLNYIQVSYRKAFLVLPKNRIELQIVF